jgi:hypothetical protein
MNPPMTYAPTPVYRRRETVYDIRTSNYYKIEAVRQHYLYGAWRTFYKLARVPGTRPEDSWREQHELCTSATLSLLT